MECAFKQLNSVEDNFIAKITKNTVSFFHDKKLFFRNATRKTRPTCRISVVFEDLGFLKPRSHRNIEIVNDEYIKGGTSLTCGKGHCTQKMVSGIDWENFIYNAKTKII